MFEVVSEVPQTPLTVDWQKKDRKARSLILSIEDAQILQVKKLDHSKENVGRIKEY